MGTIHRGGAVALAIGLALTATAWPVPAARAATCATSEAGYPLVSGAASFTTATQAFATSDDCFRYGFDLPAGTIAVKHCGGLGQTWVKARDQFDITGVPSGTNVSVFAELWVDGEIISYGCGSSGCYGHLRSSLTSGGVASEQTLTRHMYAAGTEPVHGGTVLPLTITAGQPVLLEYALAGYRSAGGNHGALGSGQLRFSGLPPGAAIVSCRGFSQLPVPALRSSWGRVKTLYR